LSNKHIELEMKEMLEQKEVEIKSLKSKLEVAD